jgi:hypothetical protein
LRLGAGRKLEEFAATARYYGLKWTSGRVGDFESGRTTPTLPTLILVTATLSNLIGRKVAVPDLFEGAGRVAISDRLSLDLSAVRAAFSEGAAVTALDMTHVRDTVKRSLAEWEELRKGWPQPLQAVPSGKIRGVCRAMSDSDKRMRKNIGVDFYMGAAAMTKLWGKPFTTRRDELTQPGAKAQEWGQVSQRLKAELERVVR